MTRTRWGLEMRAIEAKDVDARRRGIPIGRYVVGLMFVGGGLAGLAGMAEVSAIQGRLRPSLSPGYGYSGFLISWMAGGHPAGIVAAAFVLAVITAGGDILQMTQALPASVVNILLAVLLFVVLGRQAQRLMGALLRTLLADPSSPARRCSTRPWPNCSVSAPAS